MRIVEQSAELDQYSIPYDHLLKKLEKCGRVCYKSEGKTTETSAYTFVPRLIESNHLSVLEHDILTVYLVTDRGVSHELVRHRLASYSQESTRYVRYKNEITVIKPLGLTDFQEAMWEYYARLEEGNYLAMLRYGMTPEQARALLPTCTKTEIAMSANIREWRHIIQTRTSVAAHPMIRDLMGKVLDIFKQNYPLFFKDL